MNTPGELRLVEAAVARPRPLAQSNFAIELVRQLVVPTFVLDAQGRVIVWNEACERLTDMPAADVIGTREHWRAFYDQPRPCLADLIIQNRAAEIGDYYLSWEERDGGAFGAHAENWCVMPLHGRQLCLAVDAGPIRDDFGNIVAVVETLRDITDLKQTQQRLESMVNYDLLTALPNRALLADRLQQALAGAERYTRIIAVCFLDLDGFKPINDRYGHEVGDRFLIEVASRLTHTLRAGDTVARLGGDEFVLLICDLSDADELEAALARILRTVAMPYAICGHSLEVSASIGVTIYPFDDSDPDTLLRHADQAMYQAKQLGRNRFHLFDREAASHTQSRNRQLDRLRQAVAEGELRLHYQPKVNMRNGAVVGLEALVRWQHPERGLLSPVEFLPLAERDRLIVDIGEWVLEAALDQMSAWARNDLPMPVSVNIAAEHFQQESFVEHLHAMLARHPGVSPDLLELEIIESVALADIGAVRAAMSACQSRGVRFALDDFGTGYSSLSYLKRLTANTLKIDQSFVRDMLEDQEDLAIIEGVIGLAEAFRMEVIAEGVESVAHGLALMRLGCDLAQGYCIARPLPAERVDEWVRNYRPEPAWLEGTGRAADAGPTR